MSPDIAVSLLLGKPKKKWRFAIFLARFLVIVSVMLVSNTSLKRITCLVSQWSQWEVVWEKRGKGFFVFKWVKRLDLQKSSTWPSIMNRQPSHESNQHGCFLSKSGPWPAVRCSHALLPTWQSGREGKFLASDPGPKFRNIRKFVPAKIRDTACQLDYGVSWVLFVNQSIWRWEENDKSQANTFFTYISTSSTASKSCAVSIPASKCRKSCRAAKNPGPPPPFLEPTDSNTT